MSSALPDPYLVLGVGRNATDSEIRAAYRKLVGLYHPDRHQGNPLEELASARMVEVNQAYAILSNAALRAAYDGRPRPDGAAVRPAGPNPPAGARSTGRFLRLLAFIIAFPVILRFAGGIGRLLAGLARSAAGGMGLIRGTPVAAAAMLVIAAVLLWVILRRRTRRRRQRPDRSRR
jgi:curved DNA-binding protein